MDKIRIGVDIGQRNDPTAICVMETESNNPDRRFLVRHLERIPLGTEYPKVVSRISEIIQRVSSIGGHSTTVVVDATGVGMPIVDMLSEKIPLTVNLIAVQLVSGSSLTSQFLDKYTLVRLGKRRLVETLQKALRSKRLTLPDNSSVESEALRRELAQYEMRFTERGTDTYGAFKSGSHDDMVTSVALAIAGA